MPLASEDHKHPPPKQEPVPVLATPPGYRGVTVDTRYTPAKALLTHLEGKSWTVNYYSQILNTDNAVSGQDVNRNAIYQGYSLIERFEFKVAQELTDTQDEAQKSVTTTGAAHIYPCLIPNKGDMFLADIGDGREGVFEVTKSERKSIFKDAAHYIEYVLVDYSTDTRRLDFKTKTVITYEFVRDFLQHGQNPLIVKSEYELLGRLQARAEDIVPVYFKKYISKEFRTTAIPSQMYHMYDHFLAKALRAFFEVETAPELIWMRVLNCDGDKWMEQPTIWDVLKTKNKNLLKGCTQQVGLTYARSFEFNPMMESVCHSGFGFVVYPNLNLPLGQMAVDNQYDFQNNGKPLAYDTILADRPTTVRRLEDLVVETDTSSLAFPKPRLLPPTPNTGYYVLSQAFYENASTGQSLLELAVWDYLNNVAIDKHVLLTLCETQYSWGELEQFYFTPILLVLIRAAIRRV